MTIEAHIDSLAQKREILKQRITEEMARPMPDFVTISEMKKQNLAYKEEMHHYLIMLHERQYQASS